IIFPPSTELRANLSGCQAKIPLASPLSIRLSISLKIGRPGILADCFSTNLSTMLRFSCLAKARNSAIWSSIERTCLSSTSVDLRAYKKNFCDGVMLFMLKMLETLKAAPVVTNPSCLELTETAIKKDNSADWLQIHYSKNSFCIQSKYYETKLFLFPPLLLGKKPARAAEGAAPNSLGKMGGNQWDALRASHQLALKKPISSILVRGRGLEPPCLAALAPKASVSANFTTRAF